MRLKPWKLDDEVAGIKMELQKDGEGSVLIVGSTSGIRPPRAYYFDKSGKYILSAFVGDDLDN